VHKATGKGGRGKGDVKGGMQRGKWDTGQVLREKKLEIGREGEWRKQTAHSACD